LPSVESAVSRIVVDVSEQLSGLLASGGLGLQVVEAPGSTATERLVATPWAHSRSFARFGKIKTLPLMERHLP
jgi:hypothetical protein